ncbi:MAG: hypothetical protein ACQKBY_09790 [Verrucomicrobiales bacterium]
MSNWSISINGAAAVPVASIGLSVASVEFVDQATSSAVLETGARVDSNGPLSAGDQVQLFRNSDRFFQGRVLAPSPSASPDSESISYEVLDVWDELERTLYQQTWKRAFASGEEAAEATYYSPRVTIGLDPDGQRRGAGGTIRDALAFAAACGIDIAAGTIGNGVPLLPSEELSITIAEVLRRCMKWQPGSVMWIDHAPETPTLRVTPRGSLTELSYPAFDHPVQSMSPRPRPDLVPTGVRILYESTHTVADDTWRTTHEDKYPGTTSPTDPYALQAVIPLRGLQAQIQKQEVKTRAIPNDDDTSGAKAYLKKKFADLAKIDDTKWSVSEWTRELVDESEDDDDPGPVNPEAEPLNVGSADDLPRELVSGSITDWMRKSRGAVFIQATINDDGLDEDDKALVFGPVSERALNFTVNATDAVTKVYKGTSQWTAAEEIPGGLAQAIYSELSVTPWEGSHTMHADGVGTLPKLGTKLNLTGGRSEWASMNARVYGISIEVDDGSESVTISYGPSPHLSPQDLLEFQKMLRQPVTWWTSQERTSAQHGAEGGASAHQDTIGPYHQPETTSLPGGAGGGEAGNVPWQITTNEDGGSFTAQVSSAGSEVYQVESNAVDADSITNFDTDLSLSASVNFIYLVREKDGSGNLVKFLFEVESTVEPMTESATSGSTTYQTISRRLIGVVTITGDPGEESAVIDQVTRTALTWEWYVAQGYGAQILRPY